MSDHDAVPGVAPGAPLPPTGSDDVDWITQSTRRDHPVLSAIPPAFARYATVVVPEHMVTKTRADAALVEVLKAHTAVRSWWLGYLDTGVAHVVRPDATRVAVYVGWPYVLLKGGPQQALAWRRNEDSTPWHSALPELIFPSDRSWLVSTMWDDDWRCVGGPAPLIEALLQHPEVEARPVMPDGDATPPGHHYG